MERLAWLMAQKVCESGILCSVQFKQNTGCWFDANSVQVIIGLEEIG